MTLTSLLTPGGQFSGSGNGSEQTLPLVTLDAAQAYADSAEVSANNAAVSEANAAASASSLDVTKLDGIETLADVTDSVNVTASGALMDSEMSDIEAVKGFYKRYETLDDLLSTSNASRGTGAIWEADGRMYEEVASSVTDNLYETSSGVKLNNVDGTLSRFSSGAPSVTAKHRSHADDMSKDTSSMVGYALDAATTGGGSGTVYWVTNGTDSLVDYIKGSLRWAVEKVRTAGSGRVLFDPRNDIDVVLLYQINLPPNITIDAPGRNARIWANGDVTHLKVADNNIIIRRLSFGSFPLDTPVVRDAINQDPDLSDKIWIDQCSFERMHDGCIDIASLSVVSSDSRTTISNCVFRSHDKNMLIGSLTAVYTDPIHILVTVYGCHFDHTGQRNPKAFQQAFVHVVNCYYKILQVTDDDGLLGGSYGFLADQGAHGLIEDCWFETAVDTTTLYAAYATNNGNMKIVNCFSNNGMLLTETLPSSVTVPPYASFGVSATSGESGRRSIELTVIQGAGAPTDSSPEGVFVWDQSSSLEPDGVNVVSEGGSISGRWIRTSERKFYRLPEDTGQKFFNDSVYVKADGTSQFKQIGIPRKGSRTVSSGVITIDAGYHTVTPETGSIDDVDTISHSMTPTDGQEVMIMPASSSHTITLKSGAGNLLLPSGADVVLNGAYAETATLFFSDHRSSWVLKK